ncbi:MAG: HlyC/CorC family transporter [Eubacterium sp.]|nr:HlyC/CorC family transporter [Eubacterium sp.]
MDSSSIVQLVFLVVLLALSGFFSSAETALTTVSLNKLKTVVDEGGRRGRAARRVILMREDSSKLLSTILIGNNIVNISASALMTLLCTKLFGSSYVGVATGILTFFILIFGEITPKTLASLNNLSMSLYFSFPIYILMIILTPVISILDKICRGIFRILKVDPDKNPEQMTESELLKIVDVSSEEGVIENTEKQMITNVVDFGDAISKEIMIPRTDMVCLDVESTYEELMNVIEEENYSRIPLYEESKDHIVGVLYVMDILLKQEKLKKGELRIRDIMREPVFVYEYQRTAELFADMKVSSVTMCIVLDEYGVTAGLITMEDLIEEIVGDIRDEFDEHEKEWIKEISPGHYDVDGAVRLDDLNDAIGTSLESDSYDSIGGLMIELLDRLPEEGDMVRTGDTTLKCGRVERNRVERVDVITSIY